MAEAATRAAPRRIRALIGLCASGLLLLAPGVARAASSLSVTVDPPIAGSSPTVNFSMASDGGALFANAVARVDDGRPCENTLVEFQAASPGYIPLALGVPYVPGAASRVANRLTRPGALRVCGYLTGPTTLARDDDVLAVRLPTATATITPDPATPVFGQPVNLRVVGTAEVDAVVEVLASAGACATARPISGASFLSPAGPFSRTFSDVDLPQDAARLCLVVTPQAALDPPNEEIALSRVELAIGQNLGATLTDARARLTGRRLEVSAAVSGRFQGGVRLADSDGVCSRDRIAATIRAGRAIAVCYLSWDGSSKLKTAAVGLFGTTSRGALLTTPALTVDLGPYLRQARLVVPGVSIGFARLGMPLTELLSQGAGPGFVFETQKLILPGLLRTGWYGLDGVYTRVAAGRVRGMFTRGFAVGGHPRPRDDYHTATGLTPSSPPRRSTLRRLAAGARCRPLHGDRAFSDLCLIGPSTWWGPPGGGKTSAAGFITIWAGARVRPPSAPLLG